MDIGEQVQAALTEAARVSLCLRDEAPRVQKSPRFEGLDAGWWVSLRGSCTTSEESAEVRRRRAEVKELRLARRGRDAT